jgi:hypothetical protein
VKLQFDNFEIWNELAAAYEVDDFVAVAGLNGGIRPLRTREDFEVALVKPKQYFDGYPTSYGAMGGVSSGIEAPAANRLQAALVQTHANPLGQPDLGGMSICCYKHFECHTSLHF